MAVAILLGSVAPPIVRHTHADGDRAHDHNLVRQEHDLPSRSGSHSHNHSHDQSSHSHSQAIAESSQHFHWSWDWFDFFLPLEEQSESPSEHDRSENSQLIHWLGDDVTVTAATRINLNPIQLAVVLGAKSEDNSSGVSTGTPRIARSSLALCDSARCERSGVLQI